MGGGGLRWARIDKMAGDFKKKKAKSIPIEWLGIATCRPNSRLIREKNDLEVFPFYCVDTCGIDATSVLSYLHTVRLLITTYTSLFNVNNITIV